MVMMMMMMCDVQSSQNVDDKRTSCCNYQAVRPAVQPPQYSPAPASGDLNNHPERPGDLDLWPLRSSRTSRVIVLHPLTKFEVRPCPLRTIMAHFPSQR